MNLNKKIFYLVWGIHLLLTAIAGVSDIWINADAVREGVQVNQSTHGMLQLFLSILLFPAKPILGGWIASTGIKWLFIPAVIVNSFMWAYVVALVVKFSSGKKGNSANP